MEVYLGAARLPARMSLLEAATVLHKMGGVLHVGQHDRLCLVQRYLGPVVDPIFFEKREINHWNDEHAWWMDPAEFVVVWVGNGICDYDCDCGSPFRFCPGVQHWPRARSSPPFAVCIHILAARLST
jgi:hypothetical protein